MSGRSLREKNVMQSCFSLTKLRALMHLSTKCSPGCGVTNMKHVYVSLSITHCNVINDNNNNLLG